MRVVSVLAALAAASVAYAADIIVTVGGNTTTNGSLVFQPQRVVAQSGDNVVFNFTQGNHTATQSLFYAPCVPAHEANITYNGFDSSFRNAGNYNAITILTIPINDQNVNTTMWFFDYNTCGLGGVGTINDNESTTETLAGFVRNAVRLNGTGRYSSTSRPSSTRTSSSGSTASSTTSAANRAIAVGGLSALPLALAAIVLSLL